MDKMIDITTLIANFVTIIGISSGFIYLIKLIKQKSNPKIYIDQDLNLLMNKKTLNKNIIQMIKSQDNIDNLNVIIKDTAKYKWNTISINIIKKRYEIRYLNYELWIKRGVRIIISQMITGAFGITIENILDELIIDYMNVIKYHENINKNINSQREMYSLGIDVFVKPEKEYEIKTVLYLTKSEEEKLKGIMQGRFFAQYMMDIKDIEETNKALIKRAMLGLILQCSWSEELWNGKELKYKEQLPLILNKWTWQVGLH